MHLARQPGATHTLQQQQQRRRRCNSSTPAPTSSCWPIAAGVQLQPMPVALPPPPPSAQPPHRRHQHVSCRCADGASSASATAAAAAPPAHASADQPPAAGAASPAAAAIGAAADGAAVTAAWTLLKTFSSQEFRGLGRSFVGTPAARSKLRDALMLAYTHLSVAEGWNPAAAGPREVLLGVVASDARLAVRALRDWCDALQLEFVLPDCKATGAASVASVAGTVYVKYNAVSRVCYLSQYQGADRGVLLQLGQGPLLGHFPLGFWDEGMAKSAPELAAS